MNWMYSDVVAVLEANGFSDQTSHRHSGSAHHQFLNADRTRLVTVSEHSRQSIRPKTLESIMLSSGLPKKYWMQCSKLNKKQLKKTPYKIES